MRIILIYDLPSITKLDHSFYRKFHKFLVNNGFIMHSESVYSRLAMNHTSANSIKKLVRKNVPPEGLLSMLEITERQFTEMEYLCGRPQDKYIDSLERYIEI